MSLLNQPADATHQQSTHFVDGGDGFEHRPSWLDMSDGALYFNFGGDEEVAEQREYLLKGWDPTAGNGLTTDATNIELLDALLDMGRATYTVNG